MAESAAPMLKVLVCSWCKCMTFLLAYGISPPALSGEPEAAFMRIIQIRNPALHIVWNAGLFWKKAAATYSPTGRSTIGADGLNFSVRNGKRWSPVTIAT